MEIFEGRWDEIKGQMKQHWGKLTENDMKDIETNQQQIFGKLKKYYGYSEEQAKKAVKDFQSKTQH